MAFYREGDQFEISPKEMSGHQYSLGLCSVPKFLQKKKENVEILKQKWFDHIHNVILKLLVWDLKVTINLLLYLLTKSQQ